MHRNSDVSFFRRRSLLESFLADPGDEQVAGWRLIVIATVHCLGALSSRLPSASQRNVRRVVHPRIFNASRRRLQGAISLPPPIAPISTVNPPRLERMSQFWKIYNLDKLQTLQARGVRGYRETLTSGVPEDLFDLLREPREPSFSDSYTESAQRSLYVLPTSKRGEGSLIKGKQLRKRSESITK